MIIAYDIYKSGKSLSREFGARIEKEVFFKFCVKCQLLCRGRAIPQNDIIYHILGRKFDEEGIINSFENVCVGLLVNNFC